MMSRRKGTAVEQQALDFFNPYSHGFARVAVAVPRVRVADPASTPARRSRCSTQAAEQGAVVVAFPELGLSAYTCDDLFHQRALLDACEAALVASRRRDRRDRRRSRSSACRCGSTTGCSTARRSSRSGRVLGIVPKTYLPNYGEFYEARQFQAGDSALSTSVRLLGHADVPFGADLLFEAPTCRC